MANPNGRPKVENPRTKVIGIRVTDEEKERIEKFAKERHCFVSDVIIDAIRLILEENPK